MGLIIWATALHYAYDLKEVAYGSKRTSLIEVLLEKGADATATDVFANLPASGVLDTNLSASVIQGTTPPSCAQNLKTVLKRLQAAL